MFKRIAAMFETPTVTIQVDGRGVSVRAGLPLALALMEANVVPIRHSAVSGAPRSPLCMMGICFECLVEVDGRQNVQSCMVDVADGMDVRLPKGARRPEAKNDA